MVDLPPNASHDSEKMEPVFFIFFLFLTAAVLAVAAKTVRVVPQATVMLVERLGSFHKLADSGLHVLVPFIDKPRGVHWAGLCPGLSSIDLREQFLDMPPQSAITRDNVQIVVDAVVYWQITDPKRAVYEVVDLIGSIVQLTLTSMRSVMGDMDLDQCLSSREEMNGKLRLSLDEATDKWGVKVTRVDVKNINPPRDVRMTMEKQMTAERNRRALVLYADGERQAAITRAEGEKQAAIAKAEGRKASAILRAEGTAESRLLSAEAEAEAITRITEGMAHFRLREADAGSGETSLEESGAHELSNPAQYLIISSYIEGLKEMTQSENTKVIFMPVETTHILGSSGTISEILSQAGDWTPPREPVKG
jgi:regulator of protease activity HflC (stomatin/prohibitin superfamily)